jgi:hypothetical protein
MDKVICLRLEVFACKSPNSDFTEASDGSHLHKVCSDGWKLSVIF